jgi:hypothetical protein
MDYATRLRPRDTKSSPRVRAIIIRSLNDILLSQKVISRVVTIAAVEQKKKTALRLSEIKLYF